MKKIYFVIIFGKFFPKTKKFFDEYQLAKIFLDDFFKKNMPKKLIKMLKRDKIREISDNSYTLVEIDCVKCPRYSKMFFPGRAPLEQEVIDWLNKEEKPEELQATGTENA